MRYATALIFILAACGDDEPNTPDAPNTPTIDAPATLDARPSVDAAPGSQPDAGVTADAGGPTVNLTIDNFLVWCAVTVNGQAVAFPTATATVAVPQNSVVELHGDAKNDTFVWGYWLHTDGFSGSTQDTTMTATITVTTDPVTVDVCCPIPGPNGEGCTF